MKSKIFIKKLNMYHDSEKAFMTLFGKSEYAFWLDGNKREKQFSRFSYMGDTSEPSSQIISYDVNKQTLCITKQNKILKKQKNIFEYLNEQLKEHQQKISATPFYFVGGFIGYFGYEIKKICGFNSPYVSDYPDAYLFFSDRIIVFDHEEKNMYLVCFSKNKLHAQKWFEEIIKKLEQCKNFEATVITEKQKQISYHFAKNKKQYLDAIQQCKKLLYDGESYEICLTNEITVDVHVDYLELYKELRKINPAPYSAYLRFGDTAIVSSSPEQFLRVDTKGTITTKPIKGTVKRGITKEEDAKAKKYLETDTKMKAENLMIVDLLRNDLGKICEIGSVTVPKLMRVESFATMHQLVSTIQGKLRNDVSLIDAIKATFPGGSMTGAPKKRTMEILDKIEGKARGIYSGILGFMSLNGTMEMSMVIRTIVATPNKLVIGVGGAITVDSDPMKEYEEMVLKSQVLIQAIHNVIKK